MTVDVLARRAFDYAGHAYQAGDLVPMVPIEALAAARQGLVSLGRHYRTRDLVAETPVVTIVPEPEPVPVRRRRRKKSQEPCASSV